MGHGATIPSRLYLHLSVSYLKSSDTYIAVTETFYLVNVLILSNHIEKSNGLVNAVCYYSARILSAPSSNLSTPVLEYFWQTNIVRIYPHVDKEEYETFVKEITPTREGRLAKEQWGQYRESCRTDWMIEDLSVAEPKDPHIWREIDDPVMLAMCSRLLAREEN